VVDFVDGGPVQIHYVDAKAGRLDNHLGQGGDPDVIDFAICLLDIVDAIRFDVAIARYEMDVIIRMQLNPGARQELVKQLVNKARRSRVNAHTLKYVMIPMLML
jgi:hypothetical protein